VTDIDTLGTTAAPADGAEVPAASEQAGRSRRRGSGLSGMLLPELQRVAADLGIAGTARMRKGDLVAAITARQAGGDNGANGSAAPAPRSTERPEGVDDARGVAATVAPLEAPISGGANGGPLT
jgi:transcription termination factor Rho